MEEKNEFDEILDDNKKINEQTIKNKKILILTAAGILAAITILLVLISVFSVKKYTLTIDYILPKSSVMEQYDKIYISLEGKNKLMTSYKLDEDIKLLNIPEGTYKLKFSVEDESNIKYYYAEKELNLNESKVIKLTPTKNSIKYDIKKEWLNNDLKVILPENFDKYIVYQLLDGSYKKIKEDNKNIIWFRNVTKSITLKFSVIKDKYLYDYSKDLKVIVNKKPQEPIILSPEKNEAVKATSNFFFVWSCKDPDGDKLKYDLFLKYNGKEVQIAKDISSINFQYNDLKPGINYTFKVVAKDDNLSNSTSINFRTLLSQEKYTYTSKGNELLIYSVLDPRTPKLIKSIKLYGNIKNVLEQNKYLFVLREKSGISIIDFHSPINAVLKKDLELMEIKGLKVNSKYLFVKFKDDRISVYSIKIPYKPLFLGFTEEKYYGVMNPKITYVKMNMNIAVPIISNEYPIRLGINNKVFVKEYIVTVGSEQAKSILNNNYTSVFENLRFIFSMYKPNDFKSKKSLDIIKSRLRIALNEMFKMNDSEGVKSIKLIISKVE